MYDETGLAAIVLLEMCVVATAMILLWYHSSNSPTVSTGDRGVVVCIRPLHEAIIVYVANRRVRKTFSSIVIEHDATICVRSLVPRGTFVPVSPSFTTSSQLLLSGNVQVALQELYLKVSLSQGGIRDLRTEENLSQWIRIQEHSMEIRSLQNPLDSTKQTLEELLMLISI